MAHLDALRQRVADRELGHVVSLLTEADEVVVYPGLVFACIIKIKVLGLDIVLAQLFGLKLGNVFEEALFLHQGHTPYHNGTVFEEKHLWSVHLSIEVESIWVGFSRILHLTGSMTRDRGFTIVERCIASVCGQIDQLFATTLGVSLHL